MLVLKPCLLLVLIVVSFTEGQGQSYYGVSIRDNNRQGGIQVNLPGSSSHTFNPDEGAQTVPNQRDFDVPVYPKTDQSPQYPYNGQQPNANARPSNQGSTSPSFDQQTITHNYHTRSKTKLTQTIGSDGSLIQTIDHGNGDRQGNPGASQGNEGRNPPSQAAQHQVTVEQFGQQTTPRYYTRSVAKNSNTGSWDTVTVVTNSGQQKFCYCPKRT